MVAGSPPGAPPAAPPAVNPKQTMLGMPSNVPAAAPAAAPVDPKRTMLGIPMQARGPAVIPAQAPAVDPHRTMLGIPMQGQPGGAPAGHPPSAQQPFPAQPQQGVPMPSAKQTMLGVALPGIAPTHGQPAPQPAPSPAHLPSAKQTMLGVALPGIAPTHAAPAQAPPQAQAPVVQPPSEHRTMLGIARPGIAPVDPGSPPPAAWRPLEQDAAPQREVVKRRRKVVMGSVPLYRRPAFLIAILGAFVALFAVGVAVFWSSPPPISAEARIDAQGSDLLRISCASCPDGTVFSVNGSSGSVKARVADVVLQTPLTVGENKFVVRIDRPGAGRDEDVKLLVPIAYRIRPDLSGLAGTPPSVKILVDALKGTKVLVEGQPVALGADGKGAHVIDVTSECSGAAAEVKTIDRKVSYEITPGNGQTDRGTVTIKVGVMPLILESPRSNSVIDSPNFLIAGRTLKGAVVDIAGTQIPAGADGSFARKIRIDQMGPATVQVRATAKDQAPRIVSFTVDRVSDLEASARQFSATAKVDVPSLMADAKALAGKPVVLTGEVLDSRVQGYETVVLFDAQEGCRKTPCLVRVVRGGNDPLPKGQKLRVFGYVVGVYEAKGTAAAPEVDMAFSLPARR